MVAKDVFFMTCPGISQSTQFKVLASRNHTGEHNMVTSHWEENRLILQASLGHSSFAWERISPCRHLSYRLDPRILLEVTI